MGRRQRLVRWSSVMVAAVVAGLIVWGLLASRLGAPGAPGAGGVMLPDFYTLAGQSAPDFTLKDLTNSPISLGELRGKRVLLNFWYVACPGCQQEMPDLERFYTQAAGQGIVILGVNILDDANTASVFLQRLGITYPVVLDLHQRVFSRYGLTSTPSSVFVDSKGIIRGSVSGPVDAGQLQHYFQTLH